MKMREMEGMLVFITNLDSGISTLDSSSGPEAPIVIKSLMM